MILNHPFREVKNVLTIEGNTYTIYADVYKVCRQTHDHDDDCYGDIIKPVDNDEFEDKEHLK